MMDIRAEQSTRTADAYRLLAACFYEPDMALFREEAVLANLAFCMEKSAPQVAPMARELATAFDGQDQEQLLIEYASLFIGPFGVAAPPYGSVYMEQGRRVMGDTTMAVSRLYQEDGLSLEVKEPPDHIAIELEYLAHCSLKQSDETLQPLGFNIWRQKESAFLKDYVWPWIPHFCQRIKDATTNRYYVELARVVEVFLADRLSQLENSAPASKTP